MTGAGAQLTRALVSAARLAPHAARQNLGPPAAIAPLGPIVNMVSALVCCSTRVLATAGRSAVARPGRAALPAALRAPRRQMQAARRPIHTSVVAQSLERKVQTEGTGPSPKQGDRVSAGAPMGRVWGAGAMAASGRPDGAAQW